jgi:hypothetical protein
VTVHDSSSSGGSSEAAIYKSFLHRQRENASDDAGVRVRGSARRGERDLLRGALDDDDGRDER